MSIQIPSTYDDSMAPPGRHVLSIFGMYAPVIAESQAPGTSCAQETGERLIDAVSEYAPNFRRAIIDWQLFTPLDLERRVGLTAGNIHHLDMVPSQLFGSRPLPGWSDYRTPIDGLWLCGAGTHPGGEVSGMPGHNAAHALLAAWPDEVVPEPRASPSFQAVTAAMKRDVGEPIWGGSPTPCLLRAASGQWFERRPAPGVSRRVAGSSSTSAPPRPLPPV